MEVLKEIMGFNYSQVQAFSLILSRFVGLFIAAPVVSNPNVPKLVKIGICIFLSIIVFPFVTLNHEFNSSLSLATAILKEMAVGIFLGFFASLIFVAIQLAGQFIDYQMGLGIVNVIDPNSGVQVPLSGQFLYILGMLIFLAIGGHQLLIKGLIRSFSVLPLGEVVFRRGITFLINDTFAKIIVIAFQISAPVVAAVFLAEMGYGIMSRAIPQMNILIVGLPLKIGLGGLFLFLMLPLFFWMMKREFFNIFMSIDNLFKLM